MAINNFTHVVIARAGTRADPQPRRFPFDIGLTFVLAFTPFLMALKPWTVANFSPLLGAFWTSLFMLKLR